jgi:hypothetical protein
MYILCWAISMIIWWFLKSMMAAIEPLLRLDVGAQEALLHAHVEGLGPVLGGGGHLHGHLAFERFRRERAGKNKRGEGTSAGINFMAARLSDCSGPVQ